MGNLYAGAQLAYMRSSLTNHVSTAAWIIRPKLRANQQV